MLSTTRRVYVISDLHIGGIYPSAGEGRNRGFRMCTSVPALVAFIERVTAEPAPVELIINGDFVDFLAERWEEEEPEWRPFVASDALALKAFRRIADQDGDAAFFKALRTLLAAGHGLTVLLGNHDVELSFGSVRQELERRLDVDGARGRFRFIYDGEAYVAGDLLVEHGNRYDGWNVIDHDGLRRLRSASSRRAPLDEEHAYRVPPGSLLVSTIMNRIKEQYPFVDLLKPETEASLPILLALAPGARRHAVAIAKLRQEAKLHEPGEAGEPVFAGDISAAGPGASDEPAFASDIADGGGSGSFSPFLDEPAFASDIAGGGARDALAALLEQVMPGRAAGFLATVREASDEEPAPAPPPRDLRALLRLTIARERSPLSSRIEALQDALQVLYGDTSWDRARETVEYMDSVERRFAAGFRCVVYGHTHLAKRVERDDGRVYINTGTWADLIKVPREVLTRTADGRAKLERFCALLERGDLDELVEPVPTFARITLERGGDGEERVVSAELCDWPRDY